MSTLWQECAHCQCNNRNNNRRAPVRENTSKVASIKCQWKEWLRIMNGASAGGRSYKDFVQSEWGSGYEALLRMLFHRGFRGDCTLWWFYQLHCIRPWLILLQNISTSAKRSICSFTTFQWRFAQNCWRLVLPIELQKYLWNSSRAPNPCK